MPTTIVDPHDQIQRKDGARWYPKVGGNHPRRVSSDSLIVTLRPLAQVRSAGYRVQTTASTPRADQGLPGHSNCLAGNGLPIREQSNLVVRGLSWLDSRLAKWVRSAAGRDQFCWRCWPVLAATVNIWQALCTRVCGTARAPSERGLRTLCRSGNGCLR